MHLHLVAQAGGKTRYVHILSEYFFDGLLKLQDKDRDGKKQLNDYELPG